MSGSVGPLPVRVPIVVGVTGHCNIDPAARAQVEASVEKILKHLNMLSSGVLQVMTGLADGADLLVADIADRLGIPIVAVLPSPAKAYRLEISETNRDRFDSHWEKAALQIVLPNPVLDDSTSSKDAIFQQLGVFLARRSHILLALWEGPERAEAAGAYVKVGGTADVLRMRFDEQQSFDIRNASSLFAHPASRLDLPHAEPVLHIVTPRPPHEYSQSTFVGLTPAPGTCFLLHEWPGMSRDPLPQPDRFMDTLNDNPRRALQQIFELNEQLHKLPKDDLKTYANQLGYLRTDNVLDPPGQPLDRLKHLQAGTDACSTAYQRKVFGYFPGKPWRDLPWLTFQSWLGSGRTARPGLLFAYTIFGALAVLLFEAYSKLHGGPIYLLAYLVVFAGMLALNRRAERKEWQNRFQDYRALAEGMRVQIYWAAAALPLAVSDNYLRKQSGELGWIPFALRGPAIWATSVALHQKGPIVDTVIGGWIEDQANYFIGKDRKSGKAKENQRAVDRNQKWAKRLIFAALTVASAILLGDLPKWIESIPECIGIYLHWDCNCGLNELLECIHRYSEYLDVLTVMLLALAAAAAVSRHLRAYEAHARNYRAMGVLFERALTVLASVSPAQTAFSDVVRDLGREALWENAEWLLDHRDRPIEPGP